MHKVKGFSSGILNHFYHNELVASLKEQQEYCSNQSADAVIEFVCVVYVVCLWVCGK